MTRVIVDRHRKSGPMVRMAEVQWPANIIQAAFIVLDRQVLCERSAWTLVAHRQLQPIPICAQPVHRKVALLRWPVAVHVALAHRRK